MRSPGSATGPRRGYGVPWTSAAAPRSWVRCGRPNPCRGHAAVNSPAGTSHRPSTGPRPARLRRSTRQASSRPCSTGVQMHVDDRGDRPAPRCCISTVDPDKAAGTSWPPRTTDSHATSASSVWAAKRAPSEPRTGPAAGCNPRPMASRPRTRTRQAMYDPQLPC
jgi:hypothetical protein